MTTPNSMRSPPPRKLMTGLLLLCCAGLLTACATDQAPPPEVVVKTQLDVPNVPDYLRTCSPSPAVPGKGATQRDVSSFVIRLKSAHADCSTKLHSVDTIIRNAEQVENNGK